MSESAARRRMLSLPIHWDEVASTSTGKTGASRVSVVLRNMGLSKRNLGYLEPPNAARPATTWESGAVHPSRTRGRQPQHHARQGEPLPRLSLYDQVGSVHGTVVVVLSGLKNQAVIVPPSTLSVWPVM